jgi:glycerate 2-kinase
VHLNVLIIPDKFKGTLDARAAAEAIARGWRRARPKDLLELLPMSDGGDGFGDVMSRLLGARAQTVKTLDAAHRPCSARWWWEPQTRLALIETARVIGLAMLPPKRFHPYELDTFGLGAVFRAAAEKRAKRCLVGIGGSATNDGGFGLARSLGWGFVDRMGNSIERWTKLSEVVHVRPPRRRFWPPNISVAVDVDNPLLGPSGASRVYGPQKGLQADDFPQTDFCLHRLAQAVKRDTGRSLTRVPGAGAAGGLGFGLLAFLGARLEPGFELFARHLDLERRLRSADLVITGEGAVDKSTLMGKGPGKLAQRCRQLDIPCIGLAGALELNTARNNPFTQLHALTDLVGVKEARAGAARCLERLAAEVAAKWGSPIKPFAAA